MAQDLPPATFQSKVDIVLVPVVVRDAKGHAIGNLSKDDFQLFDKGKRQTISSFSIFEQTSHFPGNQAAKATVAEPPVSAPAAAPFGNRQISRIYLFDDLNAEFADVAAVRADHRKGNHSTDGSWPATAACADVCQPRVDWT